MAVRGARALGDPDGRTRSPRLGEVPIPSTSDERANIEMMVELEQAAAG